MSIVDLAMEVRPGAGVVCRWGAVALVVLEDEQHAEAAELLSIAKSLSAHEEPGRLAAHNVARALTAMDPDRIPTFCLVAHADRGTAVMLHGAIELEAAGPETEVSLVGNERPTWVDDYLTAEIAHIEIRAVDQEAIAPSGWPVDLVSGVVPGGGVSLRRRTGPVPEAYGSQSEPSADDEDPETRQAPAAEPPLPASPPPAAAAPAPQPAAEPSPAPKTPVESAPPPAAARASDAASDPTPASAAGRQFDLVDLIGGRPPAAEPLPVTEEPGAEPDADDGAEMVLGVRCKRDHFNHPDAANCVICGASMVQQTLQLVRGPRPPLGLLVFDDGTTFSLDTPYVIGREPDHDEKVVRGDARAIARPDPDVTLSRVHAEIRLDGWDVQIVDRGSANGTLCQQGDGPWTTLTADQPVTLRSGATVRMASHSLVFESHHKAGHQ